jgi:hypothetical protein
MLNRPSLVYQGPDPSLARPPKRAGAERLITPFFTKNTRRCDLFAQINFPGVPWHAFGRLVTADADVAVDIPPIKTNIATIKLEQTTTLRTVYSFCREQTN